MPSSASSPRGPDITAREVARDLFEAALRDDDPQALYDQAPCGYLSVLPDDRILKANRTLLTWTGYRESELARRPFTEILAVGSRLFHETHVRPLLHMNGQVKEIALDLLRVDGSTLPVLVNAVLDHTSDGAPSVTRLAIFDATERRHYERELLAAKLRAESSERRSAELARTLQETLMPPRSPRIDGIDVATAYRPAGDGTEIGGDFYDIFEVAHRGWVVTLGDVAGKGVNAAVVATLARHTIRAVAVSESSPAEILRQLNQVVLHHPTDRFLTGVVLRLTRTGDTWNVRMATGGHPPAIVLDEHRAPRTIGEAAPLVGAFEDASYEDISFEMRPGTTLVLHTDGVTEARRGDEWYGEERLVRLLQANRVAPQGLVRAILQDVMAFQEQRARDDIALLALHVPFARH